MGVIFDFCIWNKYFCSCICVFDGFNYLIVLCNIDGCILRIDKCVIDIFGCLFGISDFNFWGCVLLGWNCG